jgi:hypothetical protein
LDCGVNATFKGFISKYKIYEKIENEKENRRLVVEIFYNSLSASLTFQTITHFRKLSGLFPPNSFLLLEK